MSLKPCPACGALAYLFPYVGTKRYQVRCSACGSTCAAPVSSANQAREDWNNWPGHQVEQTTATEGYRQD